MRGEERRGEERGRSGSDLERIGTYIGGRGIGLVLVVEEVNEGGCA